MANRNQIDAIINTHRTQLEALQENYKLLNRKYKQYKRGDFNNSVEVHEYLRPDYSVGYIIYVYAEEGQDTYVKSFVYGTEPITPLTNWTKILPDVI